MAAVRPDPAHRRWRCAPRSGAARRCAGITLVEAMVAVLVLSLGLIGLASLQLNGLRFNRDAYLRSQATVLLYEVLEQLRMDRSNAVDNATYTGSYQAAAADAVCNVQGTGSAAVIGCWRVRLRDRVPGAVLTVAGPAGSDNDQFTVSLSWGDTWRAADAEAAQAESFQTLVVRL
jgi:type IV pilus assembly protein PilV